MAEKVSLSSPHLIPKGKISVFLSVVFDMADRYTERQGKSLQKSLLFSQKAGCVCLPEMLKKYSVDILSAPVVS